MGLIEFIFSLGQSTLESGVDWIMSGGFWQDDLHWDDDEFWED